MSLILTVDDRANDRELLSLVLGYIGHTMLEAATGPEALETARTKKPDLIMVDLMMPGMNGYEFVTELRADPTISDTPIVFCTATYDQEEPRRMAARCGVEHILVKPCEALEIIRVASAALGLI